VCTLINIKRKIETKELEKKKWEVGTRYRSRWKGSSCWI
jgi:hypothetical protein